MSGTTFIIDTSNIQLGQVIRTNISDQGIFRTFYNDISGNMYCALSRESNYKQVILNSAYKREVINNKDPIVDNSGMNAPFYGGTYHPEELTHMDNSNNFYIYQYPTLNITGTDISQCGCDRGPISYFTEVQLQKYKHQGTLPPNDNTVIYDTQGYSAGIDSKEMITAAGGNLNYAYNWYEGVAFGHCTTEDGGYALDASMAAVIAKEKGLDLGGGGSNFIGTYSTKGLYAYPKEDTGNPNEAFFGTGGTKLEMKNTTTTTIYRPGVPCSTTMALYVPDLINLDPASSRMARGISNEGLNSSTLGGWGLYGLLGGAHGRFITEPWQTDISHNRNATPTTSSGPSSFNVKYYISSKRPGITRLDENGDTANPPVSNNVVGDSDSSYKGRWSIYVDVKNKVRSLVPPYSPIDNDTSGNIYISRSNRATKPVYTHQLISNEELINSSIGTTKDISNVFVDLDLDISKNSTDLSFNNIYSRPYYVACSDASGCLFYGFAPYNLDAGNYNDVSKNWMQPINAIDRNKHCKIKVVGNANWTLSRWHIVYFVTRAANNCLAYATGTGSQIDYHYYWQGFGSLPDNGLISQLSPLGGFPSMDIDENGNVHIAYITKSQNIDNKYSLIYIRSKFTIPTDHDAINWAFTRIEANTIEPGGPSSSYYMDLSNNQPINLKISPYDQSVHITYQYYDTDTEKYCIKYWTDTSNRRDISKIDSSLNYVGAHTKGATIDDISGTAEVYWDLSECNCIFSRDYTRYDINGDKIGLTTPQYTIKEFNYPYGGRPALGVGQTERSKTGWNSGMTFNRTFLDKIYFIMQIKTPANFSNTEVLYILGGTNASPSSGSYYSMIRTDGSVAFGITQNTNSALQRSTRVLGDANPRQICYKTNRNTGVKALFTGNFSLVVNREYELEFYYNRANYYATIGITDITGTTDTNDLYEYFDISFNGGFNVLDGKLTIGNGGHTSASNSLKSTIYKMSIYATDISNVPTFDLSRNGEIISDASGSFSSFYDNSGNMGLLIEPEINKYRVLNAVNSLNDGSVDMSGSSYIKNCVVHDVYYFQRIDQEIPLTTFTQQIVTAFDKFNVKNNNGYYEMWAAGKRAYNDEWGDIYPLIWKSIDGGRTWLEVTTYTLGVSGEEILDLKCFIDSNNGKWVFICGENYMLSVTNDYNGINPGVQELGQNWKIIGDAPGNGDGDPSGNYYKLGRLFQNGTPLPGIKTFDFNSIEIVNINNTQSTDIFGNPPEANDFHVWVGTGKYHTESYPAQPFEIGQGNVRIMVETGSFDSEKYWFVLDSGNNTVLSTTNSNGAAVDNGYYDAATNQGAGAPYDKYHTLPADTYTVLLYDNYGSYPPGSGDGWHGKSLYVYEYQFYGAEDGYLWTFLTSGTVSSGFGPTTLTFTIGPPPGNLSYPYGLPGYKDMLLRGNFTDYSDNRLDYSYNIITNTILDTSNNPTKSINESFNSFSFGGDYSGNYVGNYNADGYNYGIVSTDSYVYQTNNAGKTWEKRLGIDRVNLFGADASRNVRGTWGTYIEKNRDKSTGNVDNSGMYIQTSTEPWNGLPGFTVAYNDSSFNLAFNPNDNTDIKTTTWDPSLNANSFWNVKIPDNSGQPVLYRAGGSNTIKTYIDDKGSNGTIYKNKQQMWVYDDYIPKATIDSNYAEQPILYLRDSEVENEWQRIEFSIVDPSLNTYPDNKSLKWSGFSDYDCSYSIVNLPFANIGPPKSVFNYGTLDTNIYSGFYKIGKVPFQIFLTATAGDAADPYTISLAVKYKLNNSTTYFLDDNQRLNFNRLGIKVFLEETTTIGNNPYGAWSEAIGSPFSNYQFSLSNKTPGTTFKYRAKLFNTYGYGWYSNETDPITPPAPSPTIENLTITTKLFENIVSWKPILIENVQSVYSYNIQKEYFDLSTNTWTEVTGFTNFYHDLSGILTETIPPRWGDLSGQLWSGPFNPNPPNTALDTPTEVKFIDVDLSLNTSYRYNITAFPQAIGTVASKTYSTTTYTSTARAQYSTYNYNYIDASFNILWTVDTDISNNCELTWDISWQEIRNDNTAANFGVIQILDENASMNGDQGTGKKRCINLPLSNYHLQADASYNFRIASELDNQNLPVGGGVGTVDLPSPYVQASAKSQEYLYGGWSEYDPSYVNVYYNFQQPPVLINASYDTNTDKVNVNWSATNIPASPEAYDVSFSNTTINREDVSYNFIVFNETSLVDPSNNGKKYYPGDYNVRVTAYYGNQVPVDISLVSQWSNELSLTGGIPDHLPSNLIATPYNNDNQPGNNTDVSYVKLSWDSVNNDDFALTGFPIPENYTLIRKTASKDYNYIVDYATDIPRTDTSFNDYNHPLGHTNPQGGPTIPRIYYYDLSANYL